MGLSRRAFLTYAGMGTYALLRGHAPSGAAQPGPRRRGKPPDFFKPIQPSRDDRLVLPPGFDQSIICRWNDPLGTKGPRGPEHFGFNNDFLAFFPIDALSGAKNNDEGLLFVNHEYPDPLFVSGYSGRRRKSAAQIQTETLAVGASVIHVARKNGKWLYVPGSRYTAAYPMIDVTGPASKVVPRAVGTLANCSGGRTPWLTALSCEENFQDYNAQTREGYWDRRIAWSSTWETTPMISFCTSMSAAAPIRPATRVKTNGAC